MVVQTDEQRAVPEACLVQPNKQAATLVPGALQHD